MNKYDTTGNLILSYSDENLSTQARKARFQEFIALKNLPFQSNEQHLRYLALKILRVRDNVYAFRTRQPITSTTSQSS